jgi:hypothetical protein
MATRLKRYHVEFETAEPHNCDVFLIIGHEYLYVLPERRPVPVRLGQSTANQFGVHLDQETSLLALFCCLSSLGPNKVVWIAGNLAEAWVGLELQMPRGRHTSIVGGSSAPATLAVFDTFETRVRRGNRAFCDDAAAVARAICGTP